jgi:hypothetical protein
MLDTPNMSAPALAQPAPLSPNLIAPLWHTALFLLALGGLAVWGAHRHGLPAFGATRATSYLVTIASEWLLFALAAAGLDGAMAEEFKTGNDLAFSTGCCRRAKPAQALSVGKNRKERRMRAPLFFKGRKLISS